MGHPTSLFLTQPDPNLKCGICLDIFSNPTSLIACSHTFCHDCLSTSMTTSASQTPSCPECRTPIESKPHRVRVIESTVHNLRVRCRNAYIDDECREEDYCPQECGWVGPLSEWAMHAARDCSVEIVRCPVSCGYKCPRGQMAGHLGSVECVEGAVRKRMMPLQAEIAEMKEKELQLKEAVGSLEKERDECLSSLKEESDQNKMLVEQNEWLRHHKEAQKKTAQNKISRLKKEKKELISRVKALEVRFENETDKENRSAGSGKKRKRNSRSNSAGRARAVSVSSGSEIEVHAVVG